MQISLNNVSLAYDGSKVIVADANFSITTGEFVHLTGVNGSGKSTLTKAILGVLKPVAGTINNDFTKIGFVPQVNILDNIYPLTLGQLVMSAQFLGIKTFRNSTNSTNSDTTDSSDASIKYGWIVSFLKLLWAKFSSTQYSDRAIDLMKQTGIWQERNVLLRDASGGQKQRGLIARALLVSPELLIMDEPFSNLDLSGQKEVSKLIIDYFRNQKVAILLIDHHGLIDDVSPRHLSIVEGKVQQC